LRDVNTETKQRSEKPLNLNELCAPTQERLLRRNLDATEAEIKKIAKEPEFKKERGPVGKRWT
jgi:hypothetical protein